MLSGWLSCLWLLAGADKNSLTALARLCEPATCSSGEQLGAGSSRLLLVAEGQLEVLDPDGNAVRTLGPGDCWGELSLLGVSPAATLRATTAGTLWTLSEEAFQESLLERSELARVVARNLAQRLGPEAAAQAWSAALPDLGLLDELLEEVVPQGATELHLEAGSQALRVNWRQADGRRSRQLGADQGTSLLANLAAVFARQRQLLRRVQGVSYLLGWVGDRQRGRLQVSPLPRPSAGEPAAAVPFSFRNLLRDRWVWLVLLVGYLFITAQIGDLYPQDPDETDASMSALDVLAGRFPVWLGCQRHYGAIKAYLDAPWVALFGPVDWAVRISNWGLRLWEPPLVMATLWLLLGRRAALAGGLIAALWPPRLQFWLLGANALASCVFLWYLMLFLLAWSYRRPGQALRGGLALGLVSGFSLWSGTQSLLVFAPAALAYMLCTWGQAPPFRRLGVYAAGFVAGATPWWLDGLRHGFFQDRYSYLGFDPTQATRGPWLRALDNWSYYLGQLGWECVSVEHLAHAGQTGLYQVFTTLTLGAIGLACLLALAVLLGPLRPRLGRPRTTRERDAVFWWCMLVGTAAFWWATVGFTAPGSWRTTVHRYTIPAFYLLPYLTTLAASYLPARRAGFLLGVGLCLGLPAVLDTLHLGHGHENVKLAANLADLYHGSGAARAGENAVREQLQRLGATYVMGEWWEAAGHGFWSRSQLGFIPLQAHGVVPLFPGWPTNLPARGPGVLSLFRGFPLERYLASQGALEGLRELPGPAPLRLFEIPEHAALGTPAARLLSIAEYGQNAHRFVRYLQPELEVEPALLTAGEVRLQADGHRQFEGEFTGHPLVWGPYVQVPPGLYQVEARLAQLRPGGWVEGTCEVTTASGTQTLCRKAFKIDGEGRARVRGLFSIDLARWIETRISLTQSSGRLAVQGVTLRHLPAGSEELAQAQRGEAGAAALERAQDDYPAQAGRFERGENSELWLTGGQTARGMTPMVSPSGQLLLGLDTVGAHSLWGPYLPLSAGHYTLDAAFPGLPEGGAELVLEVASERGNKIVWQQTVNLTAEGQEVQGSFRVPPGAPSPYEVRVFVRRAAGTVWMRGLRLRRS